jgi:hypothetical protein
MGRSEMKTDDAGVLVQQAVAEAIRRYAEGVAWGHFYSDDDIPWEPFENYSDDWINEQASMLADAIENAMLWAMKGETS